jgi:hypothetical protein
VGVALRWSAVSRVLLVLAGIHVMWGLVRLPRMVVDRQEEIAGYRAAGAGVWQLATAKLQGGKALEWLRDNTAPDAVVLHEGGVRGPIEFAAGALAPRLLVATTACAVSEASYAGRPVAKGSYGGRSGTVVLVASETDLRIEVR